MKNLKLISFVGVDAQTNLDDLLKVNVIRAHCFNEFSVLYSDSKSKTNHIRYPSYDFCKDFLKWGSARDIIPSLHLCGSVIERFLNKEPDVMDLCENAYRIQLNLNIADYPDHLKLTERILSVIKQYGYQYQIILQQNKTKEKFMQTFVKENIFAISVLHDGSGGFGREISKIEAPDENPLHFTGYAGGIKPENVVKIVNLIENANINNKIYYIDMESGVRTDNIFSVEKCQQIVDNLML